MSSQNISKRIRAVSARPTRSRPLSGSTNKGAQKTQFIQNVYGGTVVNFFGASNMRKSFHLVGTKGECQALSKYVPKNSTRDKQQLFEENLHLKKQMHKLTQQMAILKGQIQNMKKPTNKANKQLNMQFEKQMYWTGSNTHLVAGVKARYQQLKQKYQTKCEECEAIRNDVQYLQIQEFKIYSQALENQNKRLQQMLEKQSKWSNSIGNSQSNSQAVHYLLGESEEKRRKIQQKLIETEKNFKSSSQVINDRDKKIAFLEKLIIQKDNNEHHAQKKVKKLDKQKINIQQQLSQTRNILKEKETFYESKIQKLKDTFEKKFQIEKDVFDRAIFEKQVKAQKLEKEVAYLSTLLSYWKPLDQANKQVADRIISKQGGNEREQNGSIVYSTTVRPNMKESSAQGNLVNVKNRRASAQVDDTSFVVPQNIKQSVMLQSKIAQITQPKVRVRQTAEKRHSDEAQKKRKVTTQQIQDIGNLLKFRFLGQNLSIQEVKKYFDFKSGQANFVISEGKQSQKGQQQQNWSKKYITMREAKNILQSSIFNLSQKEALTLARYLVEDCNNEYIYCDFNNENERGIVKSIMRNVVGDYDAFDEQHLQKVIAQMNKAVEDYKQRLVPALKTVAPSGIITNKKFLEMITSLGIQISENCKNMLIAKMALQSQGLHALKYTLYF